MNNRAARTPIDGWPYYCRVCGLGFGEYLACEELDCALEDQEQAQTRMKRMVRWSKRMPQLYKRGSDDNA